MHSNLETSPDLDPSPNLDPTHIMRTATAFWPSKILMTAVSMGLFTALGDAAMNATRLGDALGIHPRVRRDFFDALLALGFLERDGDGPDAVYRNTPETRAFLDRTSPAYIGGMPAMFDDRLYDHWSNLEEALRTGEAQSEMKDTGKTIFEGLYEDEQKLGGFLEAMSAVQTANFATLAETFDFSRYETLCDVGGALALLTRTVAVRHPHLSLTTFDLPAVAPHAQAAIDAAGLSDRITVVSGDFFADPLPPADVVTMGNILHDWNLERKKLLIGKAYDALPEGGAFIAIENVIDDARRENAFGLMMSLNMLIELGDGFDYTGADFREWCTDAGFRSFDLIPLAGPTSAAVAYK